MKTMIDQFLKDILGDAKSVSVVYHNGADLFVNEKTARVIYNTGDRVWFSCIDEVYLVDAIDTHDGLIITY
jgi:hypothetical protein